MLLHTPHNLKKFDRSGLNIAMLGSFPPLRALSSYCLELATAISKLCDVKFISFKKLYPAFIYPGGGLRNDYTFPCTKHLKLKVSRILTWYNPLTWIREGFYTERELLHAQWWSFPLLFIYLVVCGGFKVRGRPVIFTVHNVLPHEASFLYRLSSHLLFVLGDHFIVHTEQNRRQLIKYYHIPLHRISLIPHGTLDFFTVKNVDQNEIRSRMGFSPDNKVILLFGAVRSYKGIDTALKAFAAVLEQVPEARLLIAGKLWEKWDNYAQLIKKLKIEPFVTTFLEYIPSEKVFRFFEASDLIILPYHYFDSQSGVGTTAVSFRKPMIVTAVGGLPELVFDDDFVVPPGNPSVLAGAMTLCLKNPARLKAMAEYAGVTAEKLSWDDIAKQTLAVYDKVLNDC